MHKDLIDQIFSSYIGAIMQIIIGIYIIKAAKKDDASGKSEYINGNVRLWSAGIGFVLIGITIIIAKLVGKI